MACRLTLTHAFNLAVAANVALYRRASARVEWKVVLRNASRNAVFAATLPRRHDGPALVFEASAATSRR